MTWQEKACNNKWVRVTVSVVLTVAVLLVFVLSPFAQAHAIVGVSTAAVTILIAGLAAIGITFASTGGFDTLNDYVESLLQDYALDNNIPVTSVFNGTQYSANSAGKLLLNNRFVVLIDTFAQWLIGKYNLSDNSSTEIVSAGATLADLTLYNLPLTIVGSSSDGTFEYVVLTSTADVYAAIFHYNSNGSRIRFISENNAQVYMTRYVGNQTTHATYDLWKYSGYSYAYANSSHTIADSFFTNAGYVIYSSSAIDNALKSDNVIDINNIGVGIKTGSISLPTDDTDYTSGDGAVLDVGAKWGSTYGGAISTVPEIWPEWLTQSQDVTADPDVSLEYEAEDVLEDALPQPTDVENVPGAALPLLDEDGHIQNLSFSSLWHYVAQWISDMTAGAAVVWNVATLAPSPVVNMLYAMIVLAMFFGAVKVFR